MLTTKSRSHRPDSFIERGSSLIMTDDYPDDSLNSVLLELGARFGQQPMQCGKCLVVVLVQEQFAAKNFAFEDNLDIALFAHGLVFQSRDAADVPATFASNCSMVDHDL